MIVMMQISSGLSDTSKSCGKSSQTIRFACNVRIEDPKYTRQALIKQDSENDLKRKEFDDFIDEFRPSYKEKKTVHAQLLDNTQN